MWWGWTRGSRSSRSGTRLSSVLQRGAGGIFETESEGALAEGLRVVNVRSVAHHPRLIRDGNA
ncbi:MAG: hypothetical protein JWM18_1130 [Chloroflexi bacterium]|jgi:hypothetical protein|nr:hypothetical protein [Chloroflexota bacterium]